MQTEKCRSKITSGATVSKRWNIVRSSVPTCITPAERQQLHSSRLHCSAWEKAERSEKDVQGKPTHTSGKSADLIEMRGHVRRQDFFNVSIVHVVSLSSKAILDHSRVKQWNLSFDYLVVNCLFGVTNTRIAFNQLFSKTLLFQGAFALLVPKKCCEVPFV